MKRGQREKKNTLTLHIEKQEGQPSLVSPKKKKKKKQPTKQTKQKTKKKSRNTWHHEGNKRPPNILILSLLLVFRLKGDNLTCFNEKEQRKLAYFMGGEGETEAHMAHPALWGRGKPNHPTVRRWPPHLRTSARSWFRCTWLSGVWQGLSTTHRNRIHFDSNILPFFPILF